jgi:hypothetical protein
MENIDLQTENEALKKELADIKSKQPQPQPQPQPQAEPLKQENKNEFEKYRAEQEEQKQKKENEEFLLKEFTNISFIYQTAFPDSIDRLDKMGTLSTKDKIETMARDIILRANNSEEMKKRLQELNNSSVLDKNGAIKFMFDEAVKQLKTAKTTTTNYLRNTATTEELQEISNSLFNGSTKEFAKNKAKALGLIN